MRLFPRAENLDYRGSLVDSNVIEPMDPDDTPIAESVKFVERFKRESEQSDIRQAAVKYWEQSDNMIEGKQWGNATNRRQGRNWKANLTINRTFGVQEKAVSLLVEMLPEMEILPRDPASVVPAEMMDNFFRHEWERHQWGTTLAMIADKATSQRTTFVKTYWDAHGDGGRGSIQIEPVSNYRLFFHPGTLIRDGKVRTKGVVHSFDMSRNEIISKYGVDPEGPVTQMQGRRNPANGASPALNLMTKNEMGIGETTYIGGASPFNDAQQGPNVQKRKDTYEVMECWFMDDTRVETPEFDGTTKPVAPLMYPHGRIITICNRRLLFDGPNPLKFFPFVALSTKMDLERIFGPSMINQIAEVQQELNKRRSQVADHSALTANPMGLASGGSGLDVNKMKANPGEIHMTFDMDGFKWVPPPELGREVFESIVMANQDIENISGMEELLMGQEPHRIESGIGIEKVQNAGRTRSNLRSLFFDAGLRTVAENVISMFLDFVKQPRQFRFLNIRALEQQFGMFDPTTMVLPHRASRKAELEQEIFQIQSDMMMSMPTSALIASANARIQHLRQEIQAVDQMPASDLVSFDVRIMTGTRSLTQSAKTALTFQAYEAGAIGRYTLLKELKYPDFQNAYLLKMQEEQQAAQSQVEAEQLAFEREIELERIKFENERELLMIKEAAEIKKLQAKPRRDSS